MESIDQRDVWHDLMSVADLADGPRVVKIDGKQIALFLSADKVYACNNRCPHEGFPLAEGTLSAGCVLTCNWHNWKFDLETGDTLVGGDRLRRYPTRIKGGRVLVDVSDPPPETIMAAALDDLVDAFDDHDYDRMARDVARLQKAGSAPLDALRRTIHSTFDKFEYGTGHAAAAAADWLALRERLMDDPAGQLACSIEPIAHFAWDTLRQRRFPYPSETRAFDEDGLIAAIDAEDEQAAAAYVRGMLAADGRLEGLWRALSFSALAHYQDFGHSLIYVVKSRELIERLGLSVLEPVLLMLTRSLVFATREDLIPEFKAYGATLGGWHGGNGAPDVQTLRHGGVAAVLGAIEASGANPLATYDALMDAASWQMLHMQLSYSQSTSGPVQNNIGWLDFTHALTFGNAVRRACTAYPELWPAGLLQIGCFLGRNASFVDETQDTAEWHVENPSDFVRTAVMNTVDHGQSEYIVAAHLLKTATAIEDEISARPDIPWAGTAAAALNRFLNSPLKRKHALRAANQALEIVAREGG